MYYYTYLISDRCGFSKILLYLTSSSEHSGEMWGISLNPRSSLNHAEEGGGRKEQRRFSFAIITIAMPYLVISRHTHTFSYLKCSSRAELLPVTLGGGGGPSSRGRRRTDAKRVWCDVASIFVVRRLILSAPQVCEKYLV